MNKHDNMWMWLCECDYMYVDIIVNIWMHCIWLYKSVCHYMVGDR